MAAGTLARVSTRGEDKSTKVSEENVAAAASRSGVTGEADGISAPGRATNLIR
jgi:hypothetical protein